MSPIVSICCLTFNHASFIQKTIEGFLIQKPPKGFRSDELWYEILIHDDASGDYTDEIIRAYAEKYPNKIFPIYEKENQFCKGIAVDMYNYLRAKGKYIAYCEGDDFWTDDCKLQKQIDFMEMHPEYSVCFHRIKHYNVYTKEYHEDNCFKLLGKDTGCEITLDTFFQGWYTWPLSALFRRSMYDISISNRYAYFRDLHEYYHLLQRGKGYLMSFCGGIRNIHKGGIWSMIDSHQHFSISYRIAYELYICNKDRYTKRHLIDTIQWILDNDKSLSNHKRLTLVSKLNKLKR